MNALRGRIENIIRGFNGNALYKTKTRELATLITQLVSEELIPLNEEAVRGHLIEKFVDIGKVEANKLSKAICGKFGKEGKKGESWRRGYQQGAVDGRNKLLKEQAEQVAKVIQEEKEKDSKVFKGRQKYCSSRKVEENE